jgi:hypothetical protein
MPARIEEHHSARIATLKAADRVDLKPLFAFAAPAGGSL